MICSLKAHIPWTVLFLAIALLAPTAALAERDCVDYYFGINGPRDFAKALRCFEADKDWDFVILMHLNGEGTPADVRKAEEILEKWKKSDPDGANNLQAKELGKAIEERQQHPEKTYPRLNYCQDIAMDTVHMNECATIDDEIDEVAFKAEMAKVRAGLKPAQAGIFDRLLLEFAAFKEAERKRVYQQSIEASMRNLEAFGQASTVREGFLELIRKTVAKRELKPAPQRAYEEADRELNQVYQDDLKAYADGHEGQAFRDYQKDAREAQRHWVRYRDLGAELARVLYPKKPGFDPALSMKTAMTRIRVEELKDEPEGL